MDVPLSAGSPGVVRRIALDDLRELVPDGCTIAFGGCIMANRPMSAVRQLLRDGVDDLQVYSVLGGLDIELLIRAGVVGKLYLSHVSLGVFGVAPHFRKAIAAGEVESVDVSGNLLLFALDAGARRVPFLPMNGDADAPYLAESAGQFAVSIPCPFTGHDVLVVKSINPDVVIIHAEAVDAEGNVLLAANMFADRVLAMAAATTVVTYEREAEARVKGDRLLPRVFVDAVCQVPGGAFPTAFSPRYGLGIDWLEAYLEDPGPGLIEDIYDGDEAAYLRRHAMP